MKALLPIDKEGLRYNHIIGTGGIGSGIFFIFSDMHTLGRNESRSAKLRPFKDFCKQHIILHYISTLLGSGTFDFKTYPIGSVGNDKIGAELLAQMQEAGMNVAAVRKTDLSSTLFSVCYQYPDFSGGNITTNNSACNEVVPNDITEFFKEYNGDGKRAMVLAAPEVPLEARIELLRIGRKIGSLNIACVSSSEISEFKKLNGFKLADIISINRDEAMQIVEQNTTENFSDVISECIKILSVENDSLIILITNGPEGSYCYHNGNLEFTPAIPSRVVSTAGAGDAFLSGVLTGLCCGLPLQRGFNTTTMTEKPLKTAIELGVLLASMSVTSANTIHFGANSKTLVAYAEQQKLNLNDWSSTLFGR